MDKLAEIVQRRKACQFYRIQAILQFSVGFLLIFFAAYVAAILHGTRKGVPYFAGAFITGFTVIILSLFGGIIYYKGKHTRLEILVPIVVKPWVVVYLILSPCATGLCIVGVVITGIYGLCQSDTCSYVINTDFNMGMAAFFLVLELLCLISVILSVLLSVYFANCFTIYTCFHTKPVPGSIQVKPATDEVQLAQDMAALQMWRHRIEGDVDFNKVADHLERTRKKRLEEVQEPEQQQ